MILTDDGGAPRFAVPFEEFEKLVANENIKIDGDFVKEKNVPGRHEAHTELDAASFAIRNVVHMPVKVNV
jgi:hypothetical protein